MRKYLWGPEVQTPSYILSPLDSGTPEASLECPISFSPFLPFGALGNTAGNGGVFLINLGARIKPQDDKAEKYNLGPGVRHRDDRREDTTAG